MKEKNALKVITGDGVVKIAVMAADGAVGEYSESFAHEMAKQLTTVIESAASVSGIAESNLRLAMVFEPDTFMEHISDNVTYRRLLLLDGVSAPRDFWVKWTRLDGAVAHHMSDEVSEDNILFELGEDVSQKIREKEYRYLLSDGAEGYHDAMSRKNVTEWREIIKRSVRRGELTKIELEVEISKETRELEARLADLLGRSASKDPEPEIEETPADDEFERAMQKAREVALGTAEEEVVELLPVEEEPEDETVELTEVVDGEPEEIEEEKEVDPEQAELDEITRLALEALRNAQNAPKDEEPVYTEAVFEIALPEEPEEIEEEEEEEPAVEAEPEIDSEQIAAEVYSRADDIRAEIEAKIRLEYESRARMMAEQELAALRRQQEEMKLENERIQAEARREQDKLRKEYEMLIEQNQRAQAVREAQEAIRRAEEEKLRAEIEAQLRREAHERQRLAEAARLAIEEQNRLQAEADRVARQREEEARIAEEERRQREHEEQLKAERAAELERIRREAEEARVAAQKAMPVMGDGKYTYTSKTVKLLFRRSVDPNITTRIYEIIKATLEYYGKDKIYLKIKASVPDSQTVCLEFVHIPIEEMQLLGNIIKILGNSGLGIAKAIIE